MRLSAASRSKGSILLEPSRSRCHSGLHVRPNATKIKDMSLCRLTAQMRIYRTIAFAVKVLPDLRNIDAETKSRQFIGAFDSTSGAH